MINAVIELLDKLFFVFVSAQKEAEGPGSERRHHSELEEAVRRRRFPWGGDEEEEKQKWWVSNVSRKSALTNDLCPLKVKEDSAVCLFLLDC